MRWVAVIAFIGLFSLNVRDTTKISDETLSNQDTIRTDSTKLINFNLDIKPILQSRCSPCHFIGGKMYQRMPFDKPETILSHQPGVLRRIKAEPDAQKIKDFFAQNAKKD